MRHSISSRRTMLQTALGAITGAAVASALPAHAWAASMPALPGWLPLPWKGRSLPSLPISIDGRPARAVVDSGTTQSAINHEAALDMGLSYLGPSTTDTFTRQVSGALYRADDFSVDGIALRRITLGAFDMAEFSRSSGRASPVILGQDVLREIDVQTDGGAGLIRAMTDAGKHAWPDHHRVPLYGWNDTFPSLRLMLEDTHQEDAALDTGSEVPVMISADYARHIRILDGRRTSTAMTVGLEGPALCRTFTLDTLRIGPFTLRAVPVQVVEDWRMDLPLHVGWPVLRPFDSILSLSHQMLRLKGDPAQLAADFPKDRSGLAAEREAGRIRIVHVAHGSPAWAAGLRDGDIIVSLGDKPISADHPAVGSRLGFQPAGTRIRLGTADGRSFTIVLADYF